MTVIVIQVGQCGNQLAYEFFDIIAKELLKPSKLSDSLQRFFVEDSSGGYFARAVLVGLKTKVTEHFQASKKSGLWQFQEQSSVLLKEGSANNWACGYYKHGCKLIDAVLEVVRSEVEKSDFLEGFLLLLSGAGGTGSGLGSYIVNKLRETFPRLVIVTLIIWPFLSGEVTVQSYNCLLALSHLLRQVDLLFVQQNDLLFKSCNMLRSNATRGQVDFPEMNKCVSRSLMGFFLPSYKLCASGEAQETNLANLVSYVCPHPSYKLAQMQNIPQLVQDDAFLGSLTWDSICDELRKSSGHLIDKTAYQLPQVVLLRGAEWKRADLSVFTKSLKYASWLDANDHLRVLGHHTPIFNVKRSATLVTNGQSFIPLLNSCVTKSWEMFHASAYLHHYAKFGLAKEQFLEHFSFVEQVIAKYKDLAF